MNLIKTIIIISSISILISSVFLITDMVRTQALNDKQSEILAAYEEGMEIADEACLNRMSRLEEQMNFSEQVCEAEKQILEWEIEDLKEDIENSKPLFQQIAEDVANSHEYSDDYNCVDFTRDLVKALKEAGYEAEKVVGYARWCDPNKNSNDCLHAWTKVTVYIESTTGKVLTPEEYEENYNIQE